MRISHQFQRAYRGLILSVAGLLLAAVTPAAAQTWVGASSGSWNTAPNWSSNPSLPSSGINTSLTFGAVGPAGATTLLQNLGNPFVLNNITFNSNSAAYSITGISQLEFRNNIGPTQPTLVQNSLNPITFAVPVILSGNLAVSGVGSVAFNGSLSGTGSLTSNTTGALTLGSGSNSFSGAININSGSLILGAGQAIPAGRDVSIANGATFSTAGLSNTAGSAIGTVTLTDSTLRIPSGSGDYFINGLKMLSGAIGVSTLNFTGSTNATLHVNQDMVIDVANWIGSGASRIVNDTAAPIVVNANSLTSSVRLANGSAGQGFRFSGLGGLMTITNTGNTANLEADGLTIAVADLASLGTGSFSLSTSFADSFPGTLQYTGPSASSAKPITLGTGGGQIAAVALNTNLTLAGVISETAPGRPLTVSGYSSNNHEPSITLTANNTYTGPTYILAGTVLSVPAVANGGIASPLGAASTDYYNLVFGGGLVGGSATLQYTGSNASTNRGMSLNFSAATFLEVTNPAATLTISGQIAGGGLAKTGPGTLTLASPFNNYFGGTQVLAGRLVVGSDGRVLPSGGDISVFDAELNFGSFSNSASIAVGTISLFGTGKLRVPSGSGNYHINKIITYGDGATLDLSGSNSFNLHLHGSGRAIDVLSTSSWVGGADSHIKNDSGSVVDLNIRPDLILTSSVKLQGGFRLTGGGTFYQTAPGSSGTLILQQARLRVDSTSALTEDTVIDGGTLQYSGPSASLTSPLSFTALPGSLNVSNPTTTLTISGPVSGIGALVKTGPGSLLLDYDNPYVGGITVSGGHLDVPADARLGVANPTVNPLGALRYTASTVTTRAFTLNGGALEVVAGATLNLFGASVGGGFMRGPGTFALFSGTSLAGTSTSPSTTVTQFGPASVSNFTNNGEFLNIGADLTWSNTTNTSAGRLTVNGTMSVSEFVSNGQINIPSSGTLTNNDTVMVLGAGSRTFIGTPADHGGNLVAGPGLDLNGALLVNNGTITGTTNVNFGSLAKGAGVYGAVNVTDGGRFSPGNSPGAVTTGSTTWGAGGAYLVELADALGTAGTDWDLWNIDGILSINSNSTTNGRFTISLASLLGDSPGLADHFDAHSDYTWTILHASDGIGGFDPAAFSLDTSGFKNPLGGGHFSLESTSTNLNLRFSAVPEPSITIALLTITCTAVCRRSNRAQSTCKSPGEES